MTPEDYAAIGLKCGLEVHQQLLTDRKLFCRCPAGRYSEEYQAEVLRHMRPTLSELGEYDGTALMEKKTRKNIFYRIHQDTVCTYEFDDTPPFLPDERALDIGLEISLLLHLNMVSEIHISRKQYLDGSIPTGFQRTAILGVGGWIPYGDRRIDIRQLSIEEDSCREVSDIGHDRICLTDRLGMPLIEVVTEPQMGTPEETAEVCQVIRLMCRSTGKVRIGYGAAREDVNVSVRGGTRIEIKGVPQITRIPLLIYNEAMRQCSLLHIRGLLSQRGITSDTLQCSSADVTRAVAKTQFAPIHEALAVGHRVRVVVLKGWSGLLKLQTQEQTTFAKEFSDRVRVIACLMTLPNLVHSDTASDLLTVRDWKALRKRARADENDALILVWGTEDDVHTACEEIINRAVEATVGIPSDTRQAFKDGTSGFERVLPGPERMYPDTDLPPIAIPKTRIQRIRAGLRPPSWERIERYEGLGIPADVIEPLSISSRADLFDRLVGELKVDPTLASVILIQRLKSLRRCGLHPEKLSDEDLFEVFRAYRDGQVAREGLVPLLEELLKDAPSPDAERSVRGTLEGYPAPLLAVETDEVIQRAVLNASSRAFPSEETKHRYIMGSLMDDVRGRVEGRSVSTAVARLLQDSVSVEGARAVGEDKR